MLGDVKGTYAEIEVIWRDHDLRPKIRIDEEIPYFISWYRDYHGV